MYLFVICIANVMFRWHSAGRAAVSAAAVPGEVPLWSRDTRHCDTGDVGTACHCQHSVPWRAPSAVPTLLQQLQVSSPTTLPRALQQDDGQYRFVCFKERFMKNFML